MSSAIVHLGATVMCAHGGSATPIHSSARVTVGGMPVVTVADGYVIAGCSLASSPATAGPCVTGQFLTGSARVLVDGQPVATRDSPSLASPSVAPMVVTAVQQRVFAG